MLLFWTLAALLSGGAALLILARSAGAERASGPADPELDVYRRQLSEIDELADRGLLGPEEQRAAHAEAGRRLLGHAGRGKASAPAPPGTGRRWVLAAAVAAPLLALGGYMILGSPGFPDEPYRDRLKGWVATSRTDPSRLSLPELRAVLELIVAQRPKDPEPLRFLARAEAGQGDLSSAIRHLQTAAQLDPNSAETWSMLGSALTSLAGGQVDDQALAAFQRAASLDPAAIEPRYFIGRAEIAGGQAARGLDEWRAIAGGLANGDPRRGAIEAQIAEVARTGQLPAAADEAPQSGVPQSGAPSGGADQAAFIQSMVDRLAARLKAQPDDPAGWARLIRAYGVLGQTSQRDAAIAEARRLFQSRPDALKTALAGEAGSAP